MTYYLTAPKNVYMLNHIFNYRMEILAKMNQDIRFWSWKVFLRDPEEISPPLPLLIQNLNPLYCQEKVLSGYIAYLSRRFGISVM